MTRRSALATASALVLLGSTVATSFAHSALSAFGRPVTSASVARPHQSRQVPALLATLHGRTLEVTGSHFLPSSRVTVALLDSESWRIAFTGMATTEAAIYHCRKGSSVMCLQRDPDAGRLYLHTTLRKRISPSLLVLLYRSRNQVGVGRIRSQ